MTFTVFEQILQLLPALSPADKSALIERLKTEQTKPLAAHLPNMVGLYADDAPPLTLEDIQAALRED